jgi:serine/threonine protein kinase
VLSAATTTWHSRSGVLGAVAYMAPEQFQGRPVPQTDVYALGCLLFRLLTGSVPYSGPTEEVMYGHFMAPIPSVVERSHGRVPATVQGVIPAPARARPPCQRQNRRQDKENSSRPITVDTAQSRAMTPW